MPAYNTPGVYIEEISGGPRPIQASSTTDTGFVGVLTLPKSFLAGQAARPPACSLPATEENPQHVLEPRAGLPPAAAGSRSAGGADDAAKGKGKASAPGAEGNRFQGRWSARSCPASGTISVAGATTTQNVTLTGGDGRGGPVRRRAARCSRSRRSREGEKDLREWDLSFAADDQSVMELIATHASPTQVKPLGRARARLTVARSRSPSTSRASRAACRSRPAC
jgi:hypothetical protein